MLPVRYPGSLDRLDFGETHDDHGVVLVEVGRSGLVGEPERVPLLATPFHTITLTDPETELPGLADRFPDRDRAIVRVTVNPTNCGPSRDETARTLRRLFPRLYELKWADPSGVTGEQTAQFTPRAGFATTVRDYLAEQLKDDTDRDAVMALAETFLADGGEA